VTTPAIDRRRLRAICAGELDLAVELVDALIEDAEPLVTSIADLAERHAVEDLRYAAHALKGIAGNIGAIQLQHATMALESATRAADRDWDDICIRVGDVQEALGGVRALRVLIGEPGRLQTCFGEA
jgi:HPt (histidine-containing phosphotransfer) domain-containing protein